VGYAARSLAWNPLPALWSFGGELRLVIRPAPAFETQLWVQLERNAYPGRYALADGGLFWFANLTSPLLSVVFRQSVVLTPRLSLQLFAQIFVDSGTFGPYWSASSPARSPIAPPDLVPGAPAFGPAGGPGLQNPDFHDTVLHINAVLRWEWRLGSTLYAVYQRSQSEVPWSGPGSPPASLAPGTLGTSYDLFLLKLSYWWNP
jgi:hypothetical protein